LSDKLFLSEQKSQAASINFTKQTAQLEQRLAVAHRELQRAPSSGNATVQAKLEEQLSEFKEKVEMLEAELTRKGMEAEELDDKFIE
jgi:lipid II:glycine glycyltransferase (peptidoglycan interpeptide bridge formation enzyme)